MINLVLYDLLATGVVPEVLIRAGGDPKLDEERILHSQKPVPELWNKVL